MPSTFIRNGFYRVSGPGYSQWRQGPVIVAGSGATGKIRKNVLLSILAVLAVLAIAANASAIVNGRVDASAKVTKLLAFETTTIDGHEVQTAWEGTLTPVASNAALTAGHCLGSA